MLAFRQADLSSCSSAAVGEIGPEATPEGNGLFFLLWFWGHLFSLYLYSPLRSCIPSGIRVTRGESLQIDVLVQLRSAGISHLPS